MKRFLFYIIIISFILSVNYGCSDSKAKKQPIKKLVSLTYDDGPNNAFTLKILDILKENDAKATFFVMGKKVEEYPLVAQRIVDENNEIGIHSYTHVFLTKVSTEELYLQVNKTKGAIVNATHKHPKYFRPTYGVINKNIEENIKMPYIKWSLDTYDFSHQNANYIANRVIKNVKDGDIILMHDIFPSTVKATEIIIKELKKTDYEFVTISELLADSDGIQSGKIYISKYESKNVSTNINLN